MRRRPYLPSRVAAGSVWSAVSGPAERSARSGDSISGWSGLTGRAIRTIIARKAFRSWTTQFSRTASVGLRSRLPGWSGRSAWSRLSRRTIRTGTAVWPAVRSRRTRVSWQTLLTVRSRRTRDTARTPGTCGDGTRVRAGRGLDVFGLFLI